jgi:hypothetical protein
LNCGELWNASGIIVSETSARIAPAAKSKRVRYSVVARTHKLYQSGHGGAKDPDHGENGSQKQLDLKKADK